ncbi:MBL fold metallo-hydrolase [Krasilnikoviella flava]|uniref:L-ascorbate metabolism protein UlaG, beta-lactamase superfamily n=1 Tax=Krasilnikoviella flava TaxID=526729 RepID=A0A1T5K3Z2_9MICO|nr:MBL fold metallo-hydrolase [Krasilnikoviella flava]SKC58300.1 L-ascorbate metabolism protein UlaG, beta-lactamase superfamily [Krasilnikoviella flava]
MSSITLTTWGHAGVRLERDGRVLVVDPGTFTDPRILDGADAVLITHEHVDHLDVPRVAPALAADPALELWAPRPVVDQLEEAGAPADRLHAVSGGDAFTAAGFAVQALGQRHATIHPDMPPPENVAFLVDGAVLHPGDSFTPAPEGTSVQVLTVPVAAPWLKLGEAVDYVRQVAPHVAVPIHDAILSDAGRALSDRVVGGLGGVEYRRLAPGESLEVPAA